MGNSVGLLILLCTTAILLTDAEVEVKKEQLKTGTVEPRQNTSEEPYIKECVNVGYCRRGLGLRNFGCCFRCGSNGICISPESRISKSNLRNTSVSETPLKNRNKNETNDFTNCKKHGPCNRSVKNFGCCYGCSSNGVCKADKTIKHVDKKNNGPNMIKKTHPATTTKSSRRKPSKTRRTKPKNRPLKMDTKNCFINDVCDYGYPNGGCCYKCGIYGLCQPFPTKPE